MTSENIEHKLIARSIEEHPDLGPELINLLLQAGEIEEKADQQISVDGTTFGAKDNIKSDRYDEFIASFNGILEEMLRHGKVHEQQQFNGQKNTICGDKKTATPKSSVRNKPFKAAERCCLNSDEQKLLRKIKLLNNQLTTFIRSTTNESLKPKSNAFDIENVLNSDDQIPRRYLRMKAYQNGKYFSEKSSSTDTSDKKGEEQSGKEIEHHATEESKTDSIKGAYLKGAQLLPEDLPESMVDDCCTSSIGKRQAHIETPEHQSLGKDNNYGIDKPIYTKSQEEDDDSEITNPQPTPKPQNNERVPRPNTGKNSSQNRQSTSPSQSSSARNIGIKIPLRLVRGPNNSFRLVLDRQCICRSRKPQQS